MTGSCVEGVAQTGNMVAASAPGPALGTTDMVAELASKRESLYAGTLAGLLADRGNQGLEPEHAAMLLREFGGSLELEQGDDTVCCLCLGILADPEAAVFTETEGAEVTTTVNGAAAALREKYEVNGTGFHLDVSLPAATAVRAAALSRLFSGALTPISLKEAARMTHGARLATALGAPCDPEAGLRVTLVATAPHLAPEALWLAPRVRQQVDQSKRKASRAGKRRHGKQDIAAPGDMVASTRIEEELAALLTDEFQRSCPSSALKLAPPEQRAALSLRAVRWRWYLGGRYLKLARGIPQSCWFIDGERRGAESVEERMTAVALPALRCGECSFLAAGREDMDVRMLGAGRPFALELRDSGAAPPSASTCAALEREINAANSDCIAVKNLRVLGLDEVQRIKDEAGDKHKSYVAVCWAQEPVSLEKLAQLSQREPTTLQQQTPNRVLHRRANLTRPRTIFNMAAKPIPGTNCFALALCTQAGTYIKEFVHGDFGRTKPSLGDLLGCPITILHLDVVDVHLDFA